MAIENLHHTLLSSSVVWTGPFVTIGCFIFISLLINKAEYLKTEIWISALCSFAFALLFGVSFQMMETLSSATKNLVHCTHACEQVAGITRRMEMSPFVPLGYWTQFTRSHGRSPVPWMSEGTGSDTKLEHLLLTSSRAGLCHYLRGSRGLLNTYMLEARFLLSPALAASSPRAGPQ